MKGNEASHQMTRNVLSFAPTVKVSSDRRIIFRQALIDHLKTLRDQLCVTKDLTRADHLNCIASEHDH